MNSSLTRKYTSLAAGIAWKDALAISFVVEMDKSLQCLSFSVSTEKNKNNLKYPVQHNRVLCVIKKCCEDFCPSLAKNMKECIRCPSLPCLGPTIADVELPLLRNAISSMSPESYTIVDVSGENEVDLKEWIKAEPQLPLLIGVSVKEGTSSPSSVPELQDLMSAVAAKIPAKWRLLGIQLGVPVEVLDGIQSEVSGRPDWLMHAFELLWRRW
ncbi:hypothetical protein EMCRGX_G008019 [Ephydatia muelleri]